MRMRALLCSVVVAGSLTSVSPASAETYRARPGDTLSTIAQRHGLTTNELQVANQLADANRLVAGQALVIPRPGAAAAPAAGGTHRVAQGESLSVIARRYGTTTSALAAANGISDPHRVRAGTVLQITAGAAAASAAPTSYVVQRGDALITIARRHGTTTAELLRLNGLADANRIRAGQVLQLPGGGAAARATPTNAPAATTSVARATTRYPNLPSRLRANPDRLALIPSFERWSAHYGVPIEFLMAVTWLESGWQNSVVSHKGAVGIGQLMPVTSRWLADEIIGIPSLDPTVPDDNIRMTAAFLSWLQRAMGSRELAMAAYYQGPTSVRVLGVYPVSEVYIAAVSSLFSSFRPA
jgi:N-acetylmuramoyl-L-alanine amidase